MKKLILMVTLVSLINANADQAVDLNKGEPAPFNGVLLDKEKSNKIKNELIEKDALAEKNNSLNRSIDLYRKNESIMNEQNDLLLNKNLELTRTLNDARETSSTTKILYFLGGVILSGAAVYGASKLTK